MEEEYERLIKEMRNAYFLVQNERIVLVSDHMAEYFGYSKDELAGMYFTELVATEEREKSIELYRRILYKIQQQGNSDSVSIQTAKPSHIQK